MTESDVAIVSKALADVMRDVVRDAMATQLEGVTRDLMAIRERLAVVETREPLPGPVGPEGPPGRDGKDGQDGKAGMEFRGAYVAGKQYERGDVTVWDGSGWHCNETTTARPGDGSKAWTLFVKHGRDAKGTT